MYRGKTDAEKIVLELIDRLVMKIIRNYREMTDCALALGNFDGMHRAHMRIIDSCAEYDTDIPGGILLFENHTKEITDKMGVKLLTSFEEKCEILSKTNIDFVFAVDFNKEIMQMSKKEFFDFLTVKLKAKALFAGFNYSFAYKASGNSEDLEKMGAECGVDVKIFPEMDYENSPISSTRIRELIQKGQMRGAAALLDRNYSLYGSVVSGKQNGRKMGLPTANVSYPENKLLPPDGVYSGYTEVDGKKYPSLINIGKNPTFDGRKRTVESYILDFDRTIYSKNVTVEFADKIREEKKFGSAEELKQQINRDIKSVIIQLNKN